MPGSREALLLTPRHEYSHLVVGANNPDLPPPFSLARFRRYVRWAWLCEGAAAWLVGPDAAACAPRSCAACARAAGPSSRPRPRDAMLLGGTVFTLLERERGAARGGRAGHEPAGARRRAG